MSKAVAALLVATVVAGSACTGTSGRDETPSTGQSSEASVPGAPSEGETRTVTGILIDIDSTAIDAVEGFILKSGPEQYEVLIADDVDYGFPLGHLQEHLQDALPVTVEMEVRSGAFYALSIEDAE